eukprot:TRINITY_DN3041_c0_g1_i1.p1 TRINITY_DN3041_c0_g1~~TRINITY_DN3041_c0_g1_i1.p1  ORF type:complete len:178 (-),score=31.98 TRINITY_DN3041_c0_g1_i1:108-641(-)
MGGWLSMFSFTKEARIVMIGLDSAGKTTILYTLQLGEAGHTIPTIGFNVETIKTKYVTFTVWDVGGQDKLRQLWKHYYLSSSAVIYVVDSNDRDRIEEASRELHKLLDIEEMTECRAVLVFANKQDVKGCLSTAEVTEQMRMSEVKMAWKVQACVATEGEGLHEGLNWIATVLKKKK